MKVLDMRRKLQQHGLLLLQHGQGFRVTNDSKKPFLQKDFPNLRGVEVWFKQHHCHNRLNNEESAAWDREWETFVTEQKGKQ